MKVATYATESETRGLFDVTVQEFQVFNPGYNELAVPSTTLSIFQVEETPCVIDILLLVSSRDMLRSMRSWTVVESSVEGCISLVDPLPLRPAVPLGDPKCPALCLLDALEATYVATDSKVVHTLDGSNFFDNRHPIKNKFYFQCVLAQSDLFAAGCERFSSQMPQAFYKLLLKDPSKARPGLKAKEYQAMLDEGASDAPILVNLNQVVTYPQASLPSADDDSDVAGDAPLVRAKAVPKAVPKAKMLALADESDNSDVEVESAGAPEIQAAPEVAEDVDIAGDAPANAREFPEFILGQPVRVDTHYAPDGLTVRGRGLWVACNNPGHIKCSRYRSAALDVNVFGPRAAEFYLEAWLSKSHEDRDTHKRFRPTRSQVREVAEAHA